MNDTLNRFIDNTLQQFVAKEFSVEEVIRNLQQDIRTLSEYLMRSEPDTSTFREKAQLLKEKKEELEKIILENSRTSIND